MGGLEGKTSDYTSISKDPNSDGSIPVKCQMRVRNLKSNTVVATGRWTDEACCGYSERLYLKGTGGEG